MQDIAKDNNAAKTYGFDWAARLGSGISIASSVWEVDGPDAALTLAYPSYNGTNATVKMTGGTPFKTYIVTNRVTATDGTVDDFSFRVVVTAH